MSGKLTFFLFSLMLFFILESNAQPIAYQWVINNVESNLPKHSTYRINIGVYTDHACEKPVYIEKQQIQFKGDTVLEILIGKGMHVLGNIDSVIWSEGYYFLNIQSDTVFDLMEVFAHKALIRIPTIIKPENIEGIIEEKSISSNGEIVIPFTKNIRPKKITVDLTTSYVNLAYPADKYPIYRHYEWFDEDGDGIGNSFTLSYSENAKHTFIENTQILGEVKLYAQPFQKLLLNTSNKNVVIRISKPVSLDNHGQTFEIKGPWKMIYLIEW